MCGGGEGRNNHRGALAGGFLQLCKAKQRDAAAARGEYILQQSPCKGGTGRQTVAWKIFVVLFFILLQGPVSCSWTVGHVFMALSSSNVKVLKAASIHGILL